jgi:hypothetical protein
MTTLLGFTQELTVSKEPTYLVTSNPDTLIHITLDKIEAVSFREYITDLEFDRKCYFEDKKRIDILDAKISIFTSINSNYRKQIEILNTRAEVQDKFYLAREQQLELEIKEALKKGRKQGAVVGAAAVVLVWILVK